MKKLFTLFLTLLLATPFSAVASVITIQPGDTLSKLAATYQTTVQDLVELNGITNPDLIYAGASLEVGGELGVSIPTVVALYTDSLASKISPTASSFTLVRGTDKQERSLNGFYGFVIDEGTSVEEFFTATCVATACTVVARGIDVVDGETQVTALKQEHRRAATVKITNFPQLAVLSRILNGQESASSTFMFGNGTTNGNKQLKADNGTASLPFLQYNEGLQSWQLSDNGVDTVTLNSLVSGGLSASSSKGIFEIDSKIGVNVTSTGGALTFNTSTGAMLVYTSSSSMGVDSNNQLYWDATKNYTASGNWTFSGNMTLSNVSTSTTSIPNKSYVDQAFTTSTAGVALTIGQAVFSSATSSIFQTKSGVTTSTYNFVGFVAESVASGAEVRIVPPGQVAKGFTGLSPGAYYFLNGTTGQINTTPGTNFARVGLALSATSLMVTLPKFIARGSQAITSATSFVQTTGFYPAKISLLAVSSGGGPSRGDDRNYCTYTTNAGSPAHNLTLAWYTADAAPGNISKGTISSKTQTGFVLTASQADTANTTVYWEAESL